MIHLRKVACKWLKFARVCIYTYVWACTCLYMHVCIDPRVYISILVHGLYCENRLYSFEWYWVTFPARVILYLSARIKLIRKKYGIFGSTYYLRQAYLIGSWEDIQPLNIPQSNAINIHLACALDVNSAEICLLIPFALSWKEKGMNIFNYHLSALKGQCVNTIPTQISICPNMHSTHHFFRWNIVCSTLSCVTSLIIYYFS